MKIGIIAEEYGVHMGGIGNSSQRIARGLCGLGHDVIAISFDSTGYLTDPDSHSTVTDEGVSVYLLGPWLSSKMPKAVDAQFLPKMVEGTLIRRMVDRVFRIFEDEPVDCILGFYLVYSGFIASLAAGKLNVPLVAGIRGSDIGARLYMDSQFGMVHHVLKAADRIVSVNHFLKDRMLLAFPEMQEKSTVIWNSISVPQNGLSRNEARKTVLEITGWDDSDLILVFAGELREKKGLQVMTKLLEAVAGSKIKFLVIGRGLTMRSQLATGGKWKGFAENGQLHFSGQVSKREVINLTCGCDVAFYPSASDGLANGLLEGMALGLCPLVSDVFAEIVEHRKSGWVERAGDTGGFIQAVRELEQSRDLVIEYGARAADLMRENFRPEIEFNAYDSLFRELVPGQP